MLDEDMSMFISDYLGLFDDLVDAYDRESDLAPIIKKIADISGVEEEQVIKYANCYILDIEECVARTQANRPHCPTCSSTNVCKISGMSKAGSVLAFGIFSQKIKRQFHCDNCGYEW